MKRDSPSWKRIALWWADFQWPVIGAVVVVAFVLAYLGGGHDDQPFWERVYRTMVTFGLARSTLQGAHTWPLAIARWLLVLVALFAVLKAWGAIFREQAQRLLLRRRTGHTIICGGGDQGLLLATAFRERGDNVVLIERDPGSVGVQSPDSAIVTIVGNALDHDLLERAGVRRASYLLALCGDDGTNAEIAARTRALLADGGRRGIMNCFVHIGDLDLYQLIRERELHSGDQHHFRLQCFNNYESGARAMLREHPMTGPGERAPLAPHAVVIGLGRFGESLAIHGVRSWSATSPNAGVLRLTVVDLEAGRKVESLESRYPALRQTCSFLSYNLDVRSSRFQEGSFLDEAQQRHGPISAVYFCLRDEPTAISAALGLRHALRQRRLHAVVRVRQDAGLVALVAAGSGSDAAGEIEFFGLLPRACDLAVVLNGTNEILARAIHESYVAAQSSAADSRATSPSLVSWDELPDSLKDVNREQADDIGKKLASVGCRIAPLLDWTQPLIELTTEEIERLAIMEHDRWTQQLRRDGWTLHASPKDAIRKRHPNLVPWEQLTDDDKEKDRQAVRNIPPLLARVGFRVIRVGSLAERRAAAATIDAARNWLGGLSQ